MHLKTTFPLFISLLTFFIYCAHQVPPSGGPEDKEGPTVVTMVPQPEAVNVRKNSRVILTFSEWLHPSSNKGIAIYPEIPIKTKVNGKRLEIRPVAPLNDSTTYHIVITTALKDLRNNPMGKPLSIVFSTGPALDSGTVSGCVADPSRQPLQPVVALFRAPWQPYDTGFTGPASYLAQADSSGRFTLNHIRTGTYFCIAYNDKNADSRLDAGTETLFTPADSIITISAKHDEITLYPSGFDTLSQSIASVKAIDNRTIVGYWKKPWDSLLYPSHPEFSLETADSQPSVLSLTRQPTNLPTTFTLLCDTTLDSVSYRLIYTIKSLFDSATVTDTLRINGAALADTTKPFLKMFMPRNALRLQPDIRLIWSEPVFCKDTLILADSLGDTLHLFGNTFASDTSHFRPEHSLLPGRTYTVTLFTSDARDLNNNPLQSKDSTDTATVITISTIPADSIAISLQGKSPCLTASPKRKWLFKPQKNDLTFTTADNHNSFRFDSLPSCKGKIGTFIDFNDNDIPDNGRLLPFVAPEPFIMFDDTIEARARWDIEGIELGPCDPCFRRPTASESDSTDTQ